MEAIGVDHTTQIKGVVVGDDEAMLHGGVFLYGDHFHIKIAVEWESKHVENRDGKVGVACHKILAQIGSDVDDGLVGVGAAAATRGDVLFFAAAHKQCCNGNQ